MLGALLELDAPSHHGEFTAVAVLNREKNIPPVETIAFCVVISSCESFSVTEGAAVLGYSIRRASIYGTLGGRYDYKLYAVHHPDAYTCSKQLEDIGYTLLERETPVRVQDIRGEFLRKNIVSNGCCGENELLKLEAYTLIQHNVVVLLDVDALVLKPMDNLFDYMLKGIKPPENETEFSYRNSLNFPIPANSVPNLLYTLDYAMVAPIKKTKPVQGGFLILRPNLTIYESLRQIVLEGDFRDQGGWKGISGKFYGSMTIQGLLSHYYTSALHNADTGLESEASTAVEVNRCVYNNMASSPRTSPNAKGGGGPNKCFTGQETCEDCRMRLFEDIVSTHFTVCQKPWLCKRHAQKNPEHVLCRKFHGAWFSIRSEMEQSWGRSGRGNGTWELDLFQGYCRDFGAKGYLAIETPYGKI